MGLRRDYVGTTAPGIGHALPQTVVVLTFDAGQSVSEDIIFSTRRRGWVTPSSVVAATLPSRGGAATTARVARNVHLPVSAALYWRGQGAFTRHLCVRVLRTHPYRGGSRIYATRGTRFEAIELKRRVGRCRRLQEQEPSGGRQGTPLKQRSSLGLIPLDSG